MRMLLKADRPPSAAHPRRRARGRAHRPDRGRRHGMTVPRPNPGGPTALKTNRRLQGCTGSSPPSQHLSRDVRRDACRDSPASWFRARRLAGAHRASHDRRLPGAGSLGVKRALRPRQHRHPLSPDAGACSRSASTLDGAGNRNSRRTWPYHHRQQRLHLADRGSPVAAPRARCSDWGLISQDQLGELLNF
jgi:hypothetical protein